MARKDKSTEKIFEGLMIREVPSYANKFFYSLGFLSMTCFLVLLVTGVIMVFYGPDWWLTTPAGLYLRSVHLWAVQAFVVLMILHFFIVFLTSAYLPPRRLTWVIGSLMFFFVLAEAEFGYVLRGDFSSQWRSLQGADLYNGSGIGRFINNLNFAQVYGIHIVILPFILVALLFVHYLLIKSRGIAKPYKKNYSYRMVKANHWMLFVRGTVLVGLILVLAMFFKSPLILPTTIESVAQQDPNLMAKTLVSEIDHTSDTATYLDGIDPYQYNTTKIYVGDPYNQYVSMQSGKNLWAVYSAESKTTQQQNIKDVKTYFEHKGAITTDPAVRNPLIPVVSTLVLMAKSGLYEDSLRGMSSQGYNPTYVTRFLSDTGVLEAKAENLNMTTDQYGMIREEKGILPPGAWWLAPIGLMDHTILQNDENQDRDGAEILGALLLLLIIYPYIPIVNRLPDVLGLYKVIWKDPKLKKN